jgi:phosphomannomutase
VVDLADQLDADVALALDPDADRLAIALPDADRSWRVLSGDELGALLAAHLLSVTHGPDRLIASTVVSSRLVPAMCRAAGIHHVETLTGFKWLCRPGLSHPQWHQLLLYEEALGYAVGPDVRDKDGITAALVALDGIARWRSEGRSAWEVLDGLARRHGAHVTRNGSIRRASPGDEDDGSRDAMVARLRARQAAGLGGAVVVEADRPAPDVVRWHLAEGTRVLVRPSGTEPKVKYYVEAIEPVAGTGTDTDTGAIADARATATARADLVVADLVDVLSG